MKNHKSLKNTILTALGLLAVVLALIGIFLPVLPTTPFLLLASGLFVRSSKRMHDWLMHNRILGPYLHTYLSCRAVTRRTRRHALVFLWTSLSLSMLWIDKPIVRLVLPIIGLAVSLHLLMLKTIDDEKAYGNKSYKSGSYESGSYESGSYGNRPAEIPDGANPCQDTVEVMESGG